MFCFLSRMYIKTSVDHSTLCSSWAVSSTELFALIWNFLLLIGQHFSSFCYQKVILWTVYNGRSSSDLKFQDGGLQSGVCTDKQTLWIMAVQSPKKVYGLLRALIDSHMALMKVPFCSCLIFYRKSGDRRLTWSQSSLLLWVQDVYENWEQFCLEMVFETYLIPAVLKRIVSMQLARYNYFFTVTV